MQKVETNMKAYWLSLREDTPCRGYWDQAIVEDLLSGIESEEVRDLPIMETSIVIVPARSHFNGIDMLNEQISRIKNLILILTGDEEAKFPLDQIKHTNIRIWVQNPQLGINSSYHKIGCGYTPNIKELKNQPETNIDWFFSGQNTHERRNACIAALQNCKNGELLATEGFTKGYPQLEYFEKLASAKIAPCPSGPETVDTFRLFEALELGCIPIADTETPKEKWQGFWEWLFDEPAPFPEIQNYDSLPGYIEELTKQFPVLNNKCMAWWFRYKNKLRRQLETDLKEIGFQEDNKPLFQDTSIIIPISPIKSHPDISIVSETIQSARHHFPNAEIHLCFDGVRKEQEALRDKYNHHIRKLLWSCRFLGRIVPHIFEDHLHQSGMLKIVLEDIKTPLMLFLEQDTPLITDVAIEWPVIKQEILSGNSNLVRFHFEAQIPNEHKHMMIGSPDPGSSLLKTVQWSQRPHIASTAFYRRILTEQFSVKTRSFIEDLLHGRVHEDYLKNGEMGWNQWRLHIYHPGNKNIKRSYHLDGRQGAKKWDDTQVF